MEWREERRRVESGERRRVEVERGEEWSDIRKE